MGFCHKFYNFINNTNIFLCLLCKNAKDENLLLFIDKIALRIAIHLYQFFPRFPKSTESTESSSGLLLFQFYSCMKCCQ